MQTRRAIAMAVALLAFASAASAEIRTKEVDYRHGDTVLQGFVAWDDVVKGKRPAQTPAEKGKVKPRIVVLTGAADPMVPSAPWRGSATTPRRTESPWRRCSRCSSRFFVEEVRDG